MNVKSEHKRAGFFLLLFGAIAFSFLLSLQTPYFPLSRRVDFNDSPVYRYIGYLILQGKAPYVDAFDHKGIYFYFLSALGAGINRDWGGWPLLWLAMFAFVLIFYMTARRFLDIAPSVGIAVLLTSGVGANFWQGFVPDTFAILFVLLAYYMLSACFVSGELTRTDVFLAGVFCSAAFWMKLNLIASLIVVCAVLLFRFLLLGRFKTAGMCLTYFAAGFILASLPGILWLSAHGALTAMIEDYFFFNIYYTSFNASAPEIYKAYQFLLLRPAVQASLLILLAALLSWMRNRKEQRHESMNNFLLLCGCLSLAAAFALTAMLGNAYDQYPLALYPPLLFVLISSWKILQESWSGQRKLLYAAALVLLLLVLYQNAKRELTLCNILWTPLPGEKEELTYILDNSVPTDYIAVISPYYSGFYTAARRDSATKYIYIQQSHFWGMEIEPPIEASFWEEYTKLLLDSRPRIILYDRNFNNIDGVNNILDHCLNKYVCVGGSERNVFYVLPRYPEEEIPAFD